MINFLNTTRLVKFLRLEAAGGIVLFIAAILGLVIANSPLAHFYEHTIIDLHFRHWINDGLMVIFFFVVGLEIKREIREGELSSIRTAAVPFVAAVGGIAIPALIFYLINSGTPENMRGIAIPTATDIAFSLGVLALLGSRAPLALKIMLTAIAIIDDLAAILIIAFFYTDTIDWMMLGGAGSALAMMMAFNYFGAKGLWPYIALGIVMWLALLNSGVHATMAGVLTAFCVPIIRKEEDDESWIDHLIHKLHPWTAFLILPVFAFANAGINISGITMADVGTPLTLGIIAGLCLGKTIGIGGALMILRPEGFQLRDKLGLGLLCGIGFTMSLFIGDLALSDHDKQMQIKIGVMAASVISAVLAAILIGFRRRVDTMPD